MRNLIFFIVFIGILGYFSSKMNFDDAPNMTIEDAYAYETLAGSHNGAVFLVLKNAGDKNLTITGARTTVAKRSEVHAHKMANGVTQMVHLKQLTIPAKSNVTFKPGGYHVMMMGLNEQLMPGRTFGVVLELAGDHEIVSNVRIIKR